MCLCVSLRHTKNNIPMLFLCVQQVVAVPLPISADGINIDMNALAEVLQMSALQQMNGGGAGRFGRLCQPAPPAGCHAAGPARWCSLAPARPARPSTILQHSSTHVSDRISTHMSDRSSTYEHTSPMLLAECIMWTDAAVFACAEFCAPCA